MISFVAAFGADADHAQQVLRDFEIMFGGHLILNRFEFGGEKLDDLAALGTDHVIVVLVFVIMFVMRAAVAEAHFARESGIGKDFEGAIDGRLADGRVFFFDELIEVFVREVLFGAQKDIQDQITLGRAFETFLLDMFKKDFLLFAQWLRRGHA
jgi:hypothetical protein